MKKLFSLSLLSFILFTSCSNNISVNTVQNNEILTEYNSNGKAISGKIEWEEGFKTKATLSDIATYGIVSLIYPHNHATNPNQTVATGVTNVSGTFSFTPDVSFTPIDQQVYILEITKRIGGVNNNLMSLRTYLKWNQSLNKWESMTTTGIIINRKTTALALMTDAEGLDPVKTIGTINSSVSPSSPTDITFTPLRLIFNGTNSSSQKHIYLSNLDGSAPTQISDTSTNNTSPVMSKDGSKVLFIGSDGATNQIYLANTKSPFNPIKISTGTSINNTTPVFSEGGSKIAFVGSVDGVANIFLVVADGSGGYNTPVQVSSGTTLNAAPSFSPDSSKIVYAGRDPVAHIFMAGTTTPFNPIKLSSTTTNNASPSFSPDGSKVVFTGRDIDSVNQIYTVSTTSPYTQTTISNNAAVTNNIAPRFSPDGSKIVFKGLESLVQHIYLAETTGLSQSRVTTTTTVNDNMSFSPDSSKIVFTCNDGTAGQIYTSTTTPPYTFTKINSASTLNTSPSFSSNGTKITFSGTESTINNIYITASDGSTVPSKINDTTTTANITPSFANEKILTASNINYVSDLISNVLASNYDPVRYIQKQGDTYIKTNP